MISSSDFPCYVDIYEKEKVPLSKVLDVKVDELMYFTNINQYMHWLLDMDAEPEPWEET